MELNQENAINGNPVRPSVIQDESHSEEEKAVLSSVGTKFDAEIVESDPESVVTEGEISGSNPIEIAASKGTSNEQNNHKLVTEGDGSGQNSTSSRNLMAMTWKGSSLASIRQSIYDSSKETLKSLQTKARHIVSQNKRRYQRDGFDLDLTYITDNIIAMGFPAGDMSSGILGFVEGFYRNHMEDVIKFLESKHEGNYKVYNLCSERLYDAGLFQGKVACFPFEDHNCPPIDLIASFCESCCNWLEGGPERVCVVHCKAGMGRTGLMISCLLLYQKLFDNPSEAIQFFNDQRTTDGKGLTLPSQRRFVHYFHKFLTERTDTESKCHSYHVRGIRLHRCPYWVRPSVSVSDHDGAIFSSRKHPMTRDLLPDDIWRQTPRKGVVVLSLPGHPGLAVVHKEFKVTFHDRNGDFYCWLHTAMVDSRVTLLTSQLDGFEKRQLGSPGLQVEIVLVPLETEQSPKPAETVSGSAAAAESGKQPETSQKGPVPSAAPAASRTLLFSAAKNAFSAFQTLSLSDITANVGSRLAGSRPEASRDTEKEEAGIELKEKLKDDIFSDSDDDVSKEPGAMAAKTEAPVSAEGGVLKPRIAAEGSSPAPEISPVTAEVLLPAAAAVAGAAAPATDFKAMAEASAADASVFNIGDEEDDF